MSLQASAVDPGWFGGLCLLLPAASAHRRSLWHVEEWTVEQQCMIVSTGVWFVFAFLKAFLMWTIVKSLYWIYYSIASVLCFDFWPQGTWDLRSLTGDWTHPACIGRWILNLWTTREAPRLVFNPQAWGFPGGTVVKCRRHKRLGFDPWVGKIPRRRKWQPTPVSLPGKSHEQRSLAGYSPKGHKELDTTEALHTHAQPFIYLLDTWPLTHTLQVHFCFRRDWKQSLRTGW